MTQKQRAWLNFPAKLRGAPGRRAPSYKALRNLLLQLNPNVLESCRHAIAASDWPTLQSSLDSLSDLLFYLED